MQVEQFMYFTRLRTLLTFCLYHFAVPKPDFLYKTASLQ